MAYLEWDWDWKEKATSRKGTYRAGSTELHSAEHVKAYVDACFPKLEFITARFVGEGSPKITPSGAAAVKPIDPEHAMHGTIAELKADVRKALKEKT